MQDTYGLNGEAHARLHGSDSPVLCVMGNIGCGMEQVVDAVTSVVADDSATRTTRYRFAGIMAVSLLRLQTYPPLRT